MAPPLPLTQGALKQPNGGTRAPVTNDLVLTGGLATPEPRTPSWRVRPHRHAPYFCRLLRGLGPGGPERPLQMANGFQPKTNLGSIEAVHHCTDFLLLRPRHDADGGSCARKFLQLPSSTAAKTLYPSEAPVSLTVQAEGYNDRGDYQGATRGVRSFLVTFWSLFGHADVGKCPKSGNSRKWLGEGAKGLFGLFWAQGAKVSQESFAPPKPSFAPVQPHFAPVQEASCSRGPKDLLHPLLTTFGNFHFSGTFPGPQHPNASVTFLVTFLVRQTPLPEPFCGRVREVHVKVVAWMEIGQNHPIFSSFLFFLCFLLLLFVSFVFCWVFGLLRVLQ